MYQTYIFDLYGTLIDIHTDEDNPQMWESLAVYFRYNGLDVTGQALHKSVQQQIEVQIEDGRKHCEYPDFVMEEVFGAVAKELKGEPEHAWLHEAVRWFRILSMRKLALYDGVMNILKGLKANGKKIYLLSNGQKTFIEMELKTLRIYNLFDGVAISSEARISKPDPLFYSYLSETYKADLSSALMVGNDPRTDMEGARRVGIDGCYIHTESSPDKLEVDSAIQIWDGDHRKIPGWR